MKTLQLKSNLGWFVLILFLPIITLSQTKKSTIHYTPKQINVNDSIAKINLSSILKEIYCTDIDTLPIFNSNKPKKVVVFNDKISFSFKNKGATLNFADMLYTNILIIKNISEPPLFVNNYYGIYLNGFAFYTYQSDFDKLKILADYLNYFQKRASKNK